MGVGAALTPTEFELQPSSAGTQSEGDNPTKHKGFVMLAPELLEQLRTHLTKVVKPITLAASLDDSEKSTELDELLTQIAESSSSITYTVRNDAKRSPSFVIERDDSDVAVSFAGIPLGHEFTSLVLALLQVGGHPPSISDELAEQIRNIPGTHNFETYFSLTCQICPDVVQALNVMAVLNPGITHTAIDGGTFQDEVDERQVLAVPSIYRDDQPFENGRVTLEELVNLLDEGAAERAVETINAMDPFDVLIVGGGPAGATAAIYAARKGIRTGVVAERFGGQVLDTMGIENLISVPYTEGPKLAAALEQNVSAHDVEMMVNQTASKLIAADSPSGLHEVQLESGAVLRARTVIITTGARWRQMGVRGEHEYRNKGVAYCPHCDGPLFKGKPVAVIGGGNSGVEAAIDLAGITDHVTLIEFDTQLRADGILQDALKALPNTKVITNALTTEVHGDGKTANSLSVQDRESGTLEKVDVDGVFVQIGLLPNTEWLKDTIELSNRGEVVIDDRGQTSIPGVFAAGDCTTVPYKQIVISMGAGSTAALSAFDHLIRNPAATDQPKVEANA